MLSTKVLLDERTMAPYPGIVAAVADAKKAGSVLALISTHPEPAWFTEHFLPLGVQFWQRSVRQNGKIVGELIAANKVIFPTLAVSDFLVFGAVDADMFMAANAGAILIRANWAHGIESRMQRYGVPFEKAQSIPRIVDLLADDEPWYFHHSSPGFDVYALTNAGTYRESNPDIVQLVDSLRSHLKSGALIAPGVLVHLLSSVYATPSLFEKKNVWGFYPSSDSTNADGELMAQITHLVRQPLGSRQAKVEQPLFFRHKPSVKRHREFSNRTDPTGQLLSLHLNPEYKKGLKGATVVVLDDFLSYGVSFGVSAALLRAAGAKHVVAIAMGKFGRTAQLYDIKVTGNPFAPLASGDFKVGTSTTLVGTHIDNAQKVFHKKFGVRIE
jgi:hypothetical protein